MRRSNRHHVFHCSNIRNLLGASSVVLALGLLACSGKLAVLNERVPGEPGSDPDSMSGAGGSAVVADPTGTAEGGAGSNGSPSESSASATIPFSRSLANCPGLAPMPSYYGAPLVMPIECGNCSCENGETVCSERDCPAYKPMSRCTNDGTEAVTWGGLIQGGTLFLNAQGYGGCNEVDLIPCYVPPEQSTVASQSRYPRQATIRVLNPTPQSSCNRVVFRSLQIGLEELEEFRSDQGNLVATNYGLAALGDVSSCNDAERLADDQFTHYSDRNGDPEALRCETDADCFFASLSASCGGACGKFFLGNQSSFAHLSAEATRIRNEICTPAAESCSAMHPGPPLECPVLPSTCREHQCAEVN